MSKLYVASSGFFSLKGDPVVEKLNIVDSSLFCESSNSSANV